MTDLLVQHQAGPETGLSADPAQVAGATAHVLAITAVAARHTMQYLPLVEADRPLAVGQHAEANLTAIQSAAERPTGLVLIASVSTDSPTPTAEPRLTRVIEQWDRASENELAARVPSADSLRFLLNQSTHIIGTTLAVAGGRGEVAIPEETIGLMARAAGALSGVENSWPRGLTTLTRPSHGFISASRDLFTALEEARQSAERMTPEARRETFDGLSHVAANAARRLAAAHDLPSRLAKQHSLYAPARSLPSTPDRLADRAKGRVIQVRPHDLRGLDDLWGTAVRHIQVLGHELLRERLRRVPAPVGRPAHGPSACTPGLA
jgi:hypothetical protein